MKLPCTVPTSAALLPMLELAARVALVGTHKKKAGAACTTVMVGIESQGVLLASIYALYTPISRAHGQCSGHGCSCPPPPGRKAEHRQHLNILLVWRGVIPQGSKGSTHRWQPAALRCVSTGCAVSHSGPPSRLDGMRHGAAVVRGAQHTPGRQLLGCGAGVHLSRQFQLKTCSSLAPALCATPVRGTGVQRGARQPQLRQRKLWRLDPKASGRAGSNLGWDCRPASFGRER